MKVLIIEDEKPAALKLMKLLKEIDSSIKVLALLESVENSINWLTTSSSSPDLIFMDIQLEDGVCFDIFESINVSSPIIFTTAYNEYALQAFKVNSVDYLLKPIDDMALENALKKYRSYFDGSRFNTDLQNLISQMPRQYKERFFVKIGEHYRSILVSDISCFYIKERCNFILTNSGRHFPVDFSLDKLEKMMDPKYFFRVNRNYILHIDAIKDVAIYSTSRLKLMLHVSSQDHEIIVSRDRIADFKAWMDR